ncbi:unnamed protein product [Parnassius apollo]|uniref:(apollo) hypothetical protein n=1 Tax=Parnassius apollo TaxID=110799 RepID=A0A8S3XPR5_PARAO|nr:unnamed protein product [Parnassius apollo]
MNKIMGDSGRNYLYFLQHHASYQGDIVDTVLKIIEDDDPIPMRDMKPAQKVKTGADMFWETHQAEYETRAASSGNKVQRVHNHNSGYPKLRDELDNRRSLVKVTALKTSHKFNNYDLNCTAYAKYKKLKELKRPKVKRNEVKFRNNECRKRSIGKKWSPKKRKSHRKRINKTYYNKNRMNTGCQCSGLLNALNKKSGNDDKLTFDLSITELKNMAPNDFVKIKDESTPLNNDDDDKSILSLYEKSYKNDTENRSESKYSSQNPDTSNPSISTYNSFPSIEHEPLV